MIIIKEIESPLGVLTLASDGENLTGLCSAGQKYFMASVKEACVAGELPVFTQTEKWLETYFQGKEPKVKLPLAPAGSEFRQRVWKHLLTVPYGTTLTYGEIARRMEAENQDGRRVSAQAVGGAVGHNPIGIIIPCHRIVGSDGNLTGYAGGLDKKVKLLKLEGVSMEGLFIPRRKSTR